MRHSNFHRKRNTPIIILLLISMALLSIPVYGILTQEVIFEVKGEPGELTTGTFNVTDKGEILLSSGSLTNQDRLALEVDIYRVGNEETVGKLKAVRAQPGSGRAPYSMYLDGDTSLKAGTYYFKIYSKNVNYTIRVIRPLI